MISERGKNWVLVVDDDVDTLSGMTSLLAAEGYRVRTASSVEQAAIALRSAPPADVVVLDYWLGPRNAAELLAETRRCPPEISRTPVLVMSGDAEIEAPEHLGPLRCITKPFDPGELMDAIAALIAEGRAGRAGIEQPEHLAGRHGNASASGSPLGRELEVIAHDLRTPLNTVAMAAAKWLGAERSGDNLKRDARLILRSVDRMKALIERLADLSEPAAGDSDTTHGDASALAVDTPAESGGSR